MKLNDSIQHELGMNLGLIFFGGHGAHPHAWCDLGSLPGSGEPPCFVAFFRCLKQFLSWETSSIAFVLAVKLRT